MTISELIRKLGVSVKTIFWAIPPAGGFINPFSVLFTALFNSKGKLKYYIEESYPNHHPFFFNSAKSALYSVYSNIKLVSGKEVVAIPAYTCPDVASSAVRAGMKLYLLDCESAEKLKVASPGENEIQNLACAVGTNLYGLEDSSEVLDYSSKQGIFYIEDLCQAGLSSFSPASYGLSEDSIGLLSFGRGKAYCGAGGGILLVPKTEKFQSLIAELNYYYRDLQGAHFIDSVLYLVKLFIYWIMERPYFYCLIRLIPFTNLGETKVKLDFPIRKASLMELATMFVGLRDRESIREEKLKVLALYKGDKNQDQENREVPIRLPVILNAQIRSVLVEKHKFFMQKFGISSSYPKCIDQYAEFEGYVVNGSQVNARSIAEGIITLPMHRYVRLCDAEQIFNFIRDMKK